MLPLLIVNPTSAAGRTGRRYQDEAHAIRGALGPFEARFTNAVGHGAALARQAAGEGRPLVVAVGGDGTASEVLDGLQQAGHRGAFGFLPRGTGGDLRRTLRLPDDLGLGARALREAPPRAIDLGVVEFTADDGARVTRHFVNVASCGIGAVVVKRVNASSKALGGRLTFKLASARELLGWRDRRVRWRADGGPWTETPITAFSVCNGRYFGGGMMVAPGARIDDGLLDVTIWSGFGLLEFALLQPRIYDGRHVQLAKTRTFTARTVELEPLDGEPVLLEADGEQPGRLPARFSVLPGAVTLHGGG